MHYYRPTLANRIRQFKQLLQRYFRASTTASRQALHLRLVQRYHQLRLVLGGRRLRRLIQRTCLAAGISTMPWLASGQALPLGNVAIDTLGLNRLKALSPYYTFSDYDQDGDLDLISTNGINTAEQTRVLGIALNDGNDTIPLFGDEFLEVELTGFDAAAIELFSPEWVDIDNDGDLDLFVGTYINGDNAPLLFFENQQTETGPPVLADAVLDPFNIDADRTDSVDPTFVDIDNDGDFDLFTNGYFYDLPLNTILFSENIGTPTEPNFAPPAINSFGISTNIERPFLDAADLDGDGDVDLVLGGLSAIGTDLQIEYLENTGNQEQASFALPATSQLNFGPILSGFSIPEIADLDGDKDADLVAFGETVLDPNTQLEATVFLYVENQLDPVVSTERFDLVTEASVFPTVSRNRIYVQMNKEVLNTSAVELRVVNPQGRILQNHPYNDGWIDVSDLPAGPYWVQLRHQGTLINRPFFKQ